jgi:hypothetical protein
MESRPMKTLFNFFLMTFFIGTVQAAKLEDVSVLDLKYQKESFEVKLLIKDA